jgi:hypothetical protein
LQLRALLVVEERDHNVNSLLGCGSIAGAAGRVASTNVRLRACVPAIAALAIATFRSAVSAARTTATTSARDIVVAQLQRGWARDHMRRLLDDARPSWPAIRCSIS